jgi:hypothetical protein
MRLLGHLINDLPMNATLDETVSFGEGSAVLAVAVGSLSAGILDLTAE